MSFFYKTATKNSKLPGRIVDSSLEKMRKVSHDVWSISDADDGVVATRLREETAEVNHIKESSEGDSHIVSGDIVLFFLGGRKMQARVLANFNNTLSISTEDGYLDIPQDWVQRVAAPPQGPPSSRTITREDMPAIQPGQPQQQVQLDQNEQAVANDLKGLLKSKGGSAAMQLSDSTYLVVKSSPNGGITDEIWSVSTQRADTKSYQSVEQMVKSRGLKTMGQPIDPAKFQQR